MCEDICDKAQNLLFCKCIQKIKKKFKKFNGNDYSHTFFFIWRTYRFHYDQILQQIEIKFQRTSILLNNSNFLGRYFLIYYFVFLPFSSKPFNRFLFFLLSFYAHFSSDYYTFFLYNTSYFTPLRFFSHQCKLLVFHWSWNDSKSPQVSRTLLSILADLNNAAVCMVSTRPFISKSLTPFINPLVTVSSDPITIGITVTFML